MDSERKLIFSIVLSILISITICVLGTSYFYHWKKVEMAKQGYEEVSSVTSLNYQLGWKKIDKK